MGNFNVKEYWSKRYDKGGNSGWGSHNEKSISFKAEYVNNIIKDNNINTMCELGCGDGNQLGLFSGYTKYFGYDISSTAVLKCSLLYNKDESKEFYQTLDDVLSNRYDLSLSLDVIYHLVEDDMFRNYMYTLFSIADTVCIFSSDNNNSVNTPHVKNRRIIKFVKNNFGSFELVDSNMFNENVGFFLFKKKTI